MTRRNFTTCALSAGVATQLPGQSTSSRCSEESDLYVLPGAQAFPESIAFDSETGDFFTGSLADGSIVRGNVGIPKASVFLPAGLDGRTSVAGVKIDNRGRLFVAGGSNGNLFIYDAASKQLLKKFQVNAAATTVNDIVILRSGEVYVTDSNNPVLYRIYENQQGELQWENWLLLTDSPVQYQDGLNLNGITVTADEQYLIVGQTNLGKLFRIEIATKRITEIELLAGPLLHCDGVLLRGCRLYVAQNAYNVLATVTLSPDYLRAEKVVDRTDPNFAFPTAVAFDRGSLLITNAQLDKVGPGLTPNLPFTVSRIAVSEGR